MKIYLASMDVLDHALKVSGDSELYILFSYYDLTQGPPFRKETWKWLLENEDMLRRRTIFLS